MINIAEYLNTNYTEDQFVNMAKIHECTQPNMNSIIKTAATIAEELSQPNEKSDGKLDGIQQIKARLGESLKKKWKNKVMHGQYITVVPCRDHFILLYLISFYIFHICWKYFKDGWVHFPTEQTGSPDHLSFT